MDIDNVICESVPVVLEEIERMTGKHFEKSDIIGYNCTSDGTSIGPLIRDIYLNDQQALLEMEPVRGAVRGIAKLRAKNDVVFVTSRHNATIETTRKWVARYFGNHTPILHTGPSEDKTAHDFELLIDDNPTFVMEFAKTDRPALLFDQPWNREAPEHLNIERVKTWAEIVEWVDFFAALKSTIENNKELLATLAKM